jgi:hypothetical protein
VMFHRYKEKTEKELQAAVRLQTAARGFLARRLVQSLRGEKHLAVASRATPWPSSHEQAVVRLQAAVCGFLVRRAVRKLHLLIRSSLHQLAACAPNHHVSSILFEPPAEVEIWVCSPPARPKRVVSFNRPPALVLDRPNIRTDWFLLHLSSNMKAAVQLFPWDLGGQEDIAAVQIYILVPQLFCIFVLNNKGKPRCKRFNLKSCQVSLRQLEDELVLKGGGDVMGIIGSGHSCGAAPMCAKSERPQGALAAARARKARALAAARARKAWQRKARARKAWQRKVTDLVAKLIDLNCRGDNFN